MSGRRQGGWPPKYPLTKENGAGGEQSFCPVENHGQRTIRKARRYSGRARAVQAVGFPDFDDDAVVNAVRIGGEDR